MSVASIIEAFGGTSALASVLGLDAPVVSNWRRRGRIPAEHWATIVREADERGIPGVTADGLASLHARRATAEARP